ncbi:hypothetical protein DLJ53_18040 [Acuticoccus sediminis]|uniref:Uncharacterized protein n=1 Tax=Acuticoccus sediminis TaxID=2184697 RepID=A0A8B2NN76_9HYPH|nr:hypothetical protein [Acuticoccus sediminis]RAI01117.1 hypothetical protein DLJ53_18040 [Acuticoccus sediminis]
MDPNQVYNARIATIIGECVMDAERFKLDAEMAGYESQKLRAEIERLQAEADVETAEANKEAKAARAEAKAASKAQPEKGVAGKAPPTPSDKSEGVSDARA